MLNVRCNPWVVFLNNILSLRNVQKLAFSVVMAKNVLTVLGLAKIRVVFGLDVKTF